MNTIYWISSVAITFLIISLIIYFVYKKYSKLHSKLEGIEKKIVRQINKESIDNFHQLESLNTLYHFIKPVYPLPRSREWAASPDFLNLLFKTIIDEKPKTIVEAGSGLSSIIIGYTLKQYGITGKLYSFDDKIQFSEKSKEQVLKHKLSDFVNIIYAPIQEYDNDNEKFKWYSDEALENIEEIDLLIIDGPGPDVSEFPRYGALPLLITKLSPNALIILDDGKRHIEKRTVEAWFKKFVDLRSEYINLEKGAYVLRRVN